MSVPALSTPVVPEPAAFSRLWFWLLLLFTLLLRLLLIPVYSAELTDDRDVYLAIADRLLAGVGFCSPGSTIPTAFRPPLYPALLAIFTGVMGVTGIAVLQILMSLLAVAGVVQAARALGLNRWAYGAGLLLAIDPLMLRYTLQPMTEVTCAALVAWLVWAWCRFEQQPNWQWASLAGLLFGLTCLCRPSLLPVPALLLLLQFGMFCLKSRSGIAVAQKATSAVHPEGLLWWSTLWKTFRSSILVGLIGLAVLLPWGFRNWLVLGEFKLTTTHGGYTLLLGNNPVFYQAVVNQPWGTTWSDYADDNPLSQSVWVQGVNAELKQQGLRTEPERDKAQYNMALQAIQQDPVSFLKACLLRFLRLWSPIPLGPEARQLPVVIVWGLCLYYGAIYLLAVRGLVQMLRSSATRQLWLPGLAIVLTLCLAHLFYWTNARMRAPFFPVIALWTTAGLASLPFPSRKT